MNLESRRKKTVIGDYVQVVCNPNNEEDFTPPTTQAEDLSTETGGAMGGEMQKHTLVMLVTVAFVCVNILY